MKAYQYMFVFTVLARSCTSAVIDLSDNQVVAEWPSNSFYLASLDITMCWGEFVLEPSNSNLTTVAVETNIWEALSANGGVVREESAALKFDFSKANGIVEQNLADLVYLRVRMAIPDSIKVVQIRTTGEFDFYRNQRFPNDTHFGSDSDKESISETTSPPIELKTIPAGQYPTGKCDSLHDSSSYDTSTLIGISAGVSGSIFLIALLVKLKEADKSAREGTTTTIVLTTAGDHASAQKKQDDASLGRKSDAVDDTLPVAQPVQEKADTQEDQPDDLC